MEPKQRRHDIDYELKLQATRTEFDSLLRELRATRWTIVAVGVGISSVILATNLIG